MKKIRIAIIMLLFLAVFGASDRAFAKDKTKPRMIYAVDTTEPVKDYVKLVIKVTDESGLAEVKFKGGKRSKSYFSKRGLGKSITLKNDKKAFKVTQNGIYTFYAKDKAGNERLMYVEINNIDNTAPTLSLSLSTIRKKTTVHLNATDDSGSVFFKVLTDSHEAYDPKWDETENLVDDSFEAEDGYIYTFLAYDAAGNRTTEEVLIDEEFRAVWFTYIEYAPSFKYESKTYDEFKRYIDTAFDQLWNQNFTAVIFQVRPYADALYPSKYYPWSGFISGEQGKDPGYDPLAYMVEAAHARGLEFHAYLNPYRVNKTTSEKGKKFYYDMSDNNQAVIWMNSDDPDLQRNVLCDNGVYYYNPAKPEVRELIVNGVREIVENYDVDGIHFDDYFYPTLGTKYKKTSDYLEYNEYKSSFDISAEALNIADWRRENVSTLIKEVYAAVKEADPDCVFGISPAGNMNNLRLDDRYYCDIDKWCSESGYIDYIAPQVYWGFEHPTCPFKETVNKWQNIVTSPTVKLYIGLAGHNAEGMPTDEWKENKDILAREVKYTRKTNFVDGFIYYRYEFLNRKATQKEVKKLLNLFN
ncbi:MAG: family 10 glycosylhydrolase [Lachnospiraceae bacterium]|nr:family 10 glycosylhydrolase [Lachnospiraceae bacterium]